MHRTHIQHLYWRAGFGISPQQIHANTTTGRIEVVEDLFNASKAINPLEIDVSDLKGMVAKQRIKDPKVRKAFNDKSREYIKDFNIAWLDRLVHSKSVLRERLTLFWANHFVCRDQNIFFAQQYNNILRTHALGNFGTFVKAISKAPAMIRYLNNQQNRKAMPNENFARELMELFMLGEGNYTEKDIKESARAFTGYSHNFRGEFVLRQFHHDAGVKTFFGRTGNFDGDDIIDILLEQKQCARFICTKLYRYFVNPDINEKHIDEMVDVFYPSYNIASVMKHVFLSDWFYDTKHMGVKIKSPIEYLVGIQQIVPFTFKERKDVLKIQYLLGQTLLNPPNVAGWKGDTDWIDANTIMIRLKLPSVLLNNAKISLKEKGDFNDSFRSHYFKRNSDKLPFKTEPNWNTFYKNFESVSVDHMLNYIINGRLNKGTEAYLKTLSKASKQDYSIQLMSLPEYQMC